MWGYAPDENDTASDWIDDLPHRPMERYAHVAKALRCSSSLGDHGEGAMKAYAAVQIVADDPSNYGSLRLEAVSALDFIDQAEDCWDTDDAEFLRHMARLRMALT